MDTVYAAVDVENLAPTNAGCAIRDLHLLSLINLRVSDL